MNTCASESLGFHVAFFDTSRSVSKDTKPNLLQSYSGWCLFPWMLKSGLEIFCQTRNPPFEMFGQIPSCWTILSWALFNKNWISFCKHSQTWSSLDQCAFFFQVVVLCIGAIQSHVPVPWHVPWRLPESLHALLSVRRLGSPIVLYHRHHHICISWCKALLISRDSSWPPSHSAIAHVDVFTAALSGRAPWEYWVREQSYSSIDCSFPVNNFKLLFH